MTQSLSQAEFEAWLEAENDGGRPSAVPVFVAPKPTDKGFYRRRKAQLEFARRQMAVQAETTKIQTQMQATQSEMAAAGEDAKRVEELAGQSFALLERLNELLAEQQAFVDEQVEYLAPFIRAIKEPREDGTWGYRPRPFAAEEQAAFDAEVRDLLRESSQAEFDAMLKAASGQGAAPAVPPK